MNLEVVMGYLLAALIAAIVYLLVSKYNRDWALALHYQQELFDHAKSLVDDEDTPDELVEFGVLLHEIATMRRATLVFIFAFTLMSVRNRSSKTRLSNVSGGMNVALENAPKEMRDKLAKMAFAMAMVLERKSLLFGWMVFPMILSKRSSMTVHPKSFNDAFKLQTILTMKPGKIADC